MKNKQIKNILLCGMTLLCIAAANGQEAVTSSGTYLEADNGESIHFALGETVSFTGTSDNNVLTQGVIQPSITVESSINDDALEKYGISVYPNPTTGSLNIECEQPEEQMQYRLYTENGQLLNNARLTSNTTELSLDNAAPGIYTLIVTGDNSGAAEFKIIKK